MPSSKQSSSSSLSCLPVNSLLPSRRNSKHSRRSSSVIERSTKSKTTQSIQSIRYSPTIKEVTTPTISEDRTSHHIAVDGKWFTHILWVGEGPKYRGNLGNRIDDSLCQADGDCIIYFDDEDQHSFLLDHGRLVRSGLPYIIWLLFNAHEFHDIHGRPATFISQRNGYLPPHQPISSFRFSYIQDKRSSIISESDHHPRGRTYFLVRISTGKSEGATATEQDARREKIRNALAVIFNAPLMGKKEQDLYEILLDVTKILHAYGCSDVDMDMRKTIRGQLYNYVEKMQYLKVNKDVCHGLNMLAWCEDVNVQYRHGWEKIFARVFKRMKLENFGSVECADRLSEFTQNALREAWTSFRYFESRAEKHLCHFKFPELVEFLPAAYDGVKHAFEAFRRIVYEHYQGQFLSWPPDETTPWLNHSIIEQMRKDFAELYDALVDCNVVWKSLAEGNDDYADQQSWTKLVSTADPTMQIPMCDILVKCVTNFDQHYGVWHMPWPCPSLPPKNNGSCTSTPSKRFSLRKLTQLKSRATSENSDDACKFEAVTKFENAWTGERHRKLLSKLFEDFSRISKTFLPALKAIVP